MSESKSIGKLKYLSSLDKQGKIAYLENRKYFDPVTVIELVHEEKDYDVLYSAYKALLKWHVKPNNKAYKIYQDVFMSVATEVFSEEDQESLLAISKDQQNYPLLVRMCAEMYLYYLNGFKHIDLMNLHIRFCEYILKACGIHDIEKSSLDEKKIETKVIANEAHSKPAVTELKADDLPVRVKNNVPEAFSKEISQESKVIMAENTVEMAKEPTKETLDNVSEATDAVERNIIEDDPLIIDDIDDVIVSEVIEPYKQSKFTL